MKFEKWQALGNDYIVVERESLREPLTADQARALCDVHTGIGADGVLELSRSAHAGIVAELRILNPDGSEAELSGNGVREAVLYLVRHGWTAEREFVIRTAAGDVRPSILSSTRARVDMGRAHVEIDPVEGRADRIRARIWERGVGETASSGTGASGAAIAFVLSGGISPVTVVLDGGELEVEVDDELGVRLTGWAVPVYSGELIEPLDRSVLSRPVR